MSPFVEPFNETRYKALMNGLELSEVMFSDIIKDNEKYRFDSEFFLKDFVSAYALIKKKQHSTIGKEYSCLTDFHANGSYESIAKNYQLLDNKDYAYMVRTTDLETKNYTDNVKYISKQSYDFLSKSKVFGGEILINKIGSPGRTFLMPRLDIPVSLGMNLFLLRLKSNGTIDEPTLWLYLNTEFGKTIIQRKINGTVPLTIDKMAIKSIYTPVFSCEFRKILSGIVESIYSNEKVANELYVAANNTLNTSLGINIFNKKFSFKSIKNLSQSFGVAGRLDAEYYQPKYDALFSRLWEFETKPLGGINGIVSIKKSIEPGSDTYQDKGIPFVRVSDVSKFKISQPEIYLSENVVQNISELYPKKDTILFSKDGSVGIAYKMEEDKKMITSGALLHLTVRNASVVIPDYLTLVLNSLVVKLQAERDSNGAIIQHWKPSEIENVVIPILDISIQEEIAAKVQKSFALRRQSEQLFEDAKQAVEIAIEQDEKTALEWLKEKGVEV